MAMEGPGTPLYRWTSPCRETSRGRIARVSCWVRRSLGLVGLLGLQACAGHSDRTLEARSALDAGNPEAALKLYNEELEVKTEKDLPEDTSGDNTLLILDRSMILQQLEKYELASRDLELADKEI